MYNTVQYRPLWLLFLTLFTLSAWAAAAAAERELVILNWSEYMDPALIEAFEQQHDARVREVYYKSDDDRDEIMVAGDGRGFDLLMINGLRLEAYRRRGWLVPVSEATVPNLRHIDQRWLEGFDARGYAIPYFWGTLGIAYRRDLVAEPITRWQQLFEPDQTLRGNIVMIDAVRDLIGMALKSLGHSVNSTDPRALAEAEALLLAQKPHVRDYFFDTLTEESALVRGEIVAEMMYSGDALLIRQFNPNIEYVLPEEGGNIWVDYLALSAHARQPDLALAFLDFINEPAHAAQLARYLHYPTPNRAAEALLPADFRQDPFIYPSDAQLEKSEFYRPLPPRALRRYNHIAARILN